LNDRRSISLIGLVRNFNAYGLKPGGNFLASRAVVFEVRVRQPVKERQ
jgi:hypothetical protein